MCGGRKTLASNEMGEITSPNYPAHSVQNPNCHWILIASQPQEHITMTFTHIDTSEVSQDCTNHYVEVRDGDSGGGSDLTTSPLIGRYCGDRMPAPITSQGNALYITSSFGIFRATYATSTSFCGGEFTAVEGHFMSPVSDQYWKSLDQSLDGCCPAGLPQHLSSGKRMCLDHQGIAWQ